MKHMTDDNNKTLCGKRIVLTLFGKTIRRQQIVRWLSETDCLDCFRIQRDALQATAKIELAEIDRQLAEIRAAK